MTIRKADLRDLALLDMAGISYDPPPSPQLEPPFMPSILTNSNEHIWIDDLRGILCRVAVDTVAHVAAVTHLLPASAARLRRLRVMAAALRDALTSHTGSATWRVSATFFGELDGGKAACLNWQQTFTGAVVAQRADGTWEISWTLGQAALIG